MKAILHDWNDERCSIILRNARRALLRGSRLIVLDRVLPDRMSDCERDRALARSDLTMLVGVGGRERTEREMWKLLAAHAFAVDAIEPLPLGLSLIACQAA